MTVAASPLRVEWIGPLGLEEVLERDSEQDYGLYQIYCHHVVFGLGSLVYIGRATEQTFGVRFWQHKKEWLDEENDVSIRLGRLMDEDGLTDEEWEKWVCAAEALLIHWHSPPYNSQHINDYTYRPLHIQNWGNRGSLLPECSSDWDAPRPDDAADK